MAKIAPDSNRYQRRESKLLLTFRALCPYLLVRFYREGT